MASEHILCLDVAFCNTGYALFSLDNNCFVLSGVIRPKRYKAQYRVIEDSLSLQQVADELCSIVCKHGPAKCLAELPLAGAKSSRACRMMGMATATVVTVARMLKLPLVPISPDEVKRVVSTKGAVSKEQVQKAVERYFGKVLPPLKKDREHIADAMACLIAYKRRNNGKS